VEADQNKDGRVDLKRFFVGGQLDREEADTDWNGSFDTKSWFRSEQLLRREVDKTGDGRADVIVEFEGGKPIREVSTAEKTRTTIRFERGRWPAARSTPTGTGAWTASRRSPPAGPFARSRIRTRTIASTP
jgi:hypothetical protein